MRRAAGMIRERDRHACCAPTRARGEAILAERLVGPGRLHVSSAREMVNPSSRVPAVLRKTACAFAVLPREDWSPHHILRRDRRPAHEEERAKGGLAPCSTGD